MRLSPDRELVVPPGTNLLAPPWLAPGNPGRSRLFAALLAGGSGRGAGWKPRGDRRMSEGGAGGRESPPTVGGRDEVERERDGADRDFRRIQSSPSRMHRRLGGGGADDAASLSKTFSRDASCPPSALPDYDADELRRRRAEEEAAALAAAANPPDMSARQREIQSSLFKMLGQEDG